MIKVAPGNTPFFYESRMVYLRLLAILTRYTVIKYHVKLMLAPVDPERQNLPEFPGQIRRRLYRIPEPMNLVIISSFNSLYGRTYASIGRFH